jgi:hypothetical protein
MDRHEKIWSIVFTRTIDFRSATETDVVDYFRENEGLSISDGNGRGRLFSRERGTFDQRRKTTARTCFHLEFNILVEKNHYSWKMIENSHPIVHLGRKARL